MSNIKTFHDLLEEQKNLEGLLQKQKDIIIQDLNHLKEEYSPAINLMSGLNKLTSRSSTNPLISMGINLAGEFLQKNIPLVGNNRILQFSVPFMAKKVLTLALSTGLTQILKIRARWKKRASPHSSQKA